MSRLGSAGLSESSSAANGDLYGLVAQFGSVESLLTAARRVRDAGYTRTDAYTPFPIEGLDEELGIQPSRLGWVVLLAGVGALLGGFFMEWWANTSYYPLNIGGRPMNAWPNFIVIMYELTILTSAFTAGLFMLYRNGLPRLHHSIFNTPNFDNASRDKFFLCIETIDPQFERHQTRAFMESLTPERISEVER